MDACKFAVGEAIAALKFYEEYFGIEYPLPKCDMISLIGHRFSKILIKNFIC